MPQHGLIIDRLQAVLDPLPAGREAVAGRAAVLLALTDEPTPRIWLIRRSAHLLLHPGQMAFPGGKSEDTDANLLQTALREAEEEIALAPAQVTPCGSLAARRTLTGYTVVPFVGVVPPDLVMTPDPGEVSALAALPLTVFADPACLCVDRVWRNGGGRSLARYRVEGLTVWGMTAAFIVELVNRFYDAGLDPALHAPPQLD